MLAPTPLTELFERFNNLHVLIVGDVMVDAYVWGRASRLSPEAPVPVVNVERTEQRLGGAANVALNVQALGATPLLCAVVGDDAGGDQLLHLLHRHHLPADTILRFDLNTVPSAPPSWHAAMTAARDLGGPQEYADPSYDELTGLLGAYCAVDPAQILVGAGADEILAIICQTFLDRGDAVVVTAPTYPVHTLRPQQLGATVRVCPLDADFNPDAEQLLAAAAGL